MVLSRDNAFEVYFRRQGLEDKDPQSKFKELTTVDGVFVIAEPGEEFMIVFSADNKFATYAVKVFVLSFMLGLLMVMNSLPSTSGGMVPFLVLRSRTSRDFTRVSNSKNLKVNQTTPIYSRHPRVKAIISQLMRVALMTELITKEDLVK